MLTLLMNRRSREYNTEVHPWRVGQGEGGSDTMATLSPQCQTTTQILALPRQ